MGSGKRKQISANHEKALLEPVLPASALPVTSGSACRGCELSDCQRKSDRHAGVFFVLSV